MDIEHIFKAYRGELKRFLSSRLKNKSDVEDVLQEILIKTFRHLKSVKEPEKLRAWLYQTARNTLIDHYRRNHKKVDETWLQPDPEAGAADGTRRELSKCLRPFLKELPDKYRVALEAVELENIPQKELAEQLGLSYSALKSRVQRGRELLLKVFKRCCAYEFDARGGVVDFTPKAKSCQTCSA